MRNKTYLTLCVSALLLLTATFVPAQDIEKIKFPKLNKIQIPEIDTLSLENGLKLYLLEDKSLPVFNVTMRVNGGTFLVPAELLGLGDVTGEVMRTGGTAKWTGDEIDELLEGVGGAVSASINRTNSSASVNVLSDYTDLGLEVLAEILQRPVFDEDKIELAKVQIRSGISRRNDNVGGIASREYRKLIYGAESVYARDIEYATIDAITRDHMIGFHKAIFQPQNIQMGIVGDFDKKQIIAKVKELFGSWERGATVVPPPPAVEYNFIKKAYLVNKPDAKQTYIRIGHIGGLVSDDDYTARIVMNSILGGGFGSRLTNNVRTRLGLAYTAVGTYGANNAYPGMFFAHASTGNANAIKAAREMVVQINSMLTEQPSVEEMEKGKVGYLNSFVFNFDSKGEVLSRMMAYDFYGLPRNFLQMTKEGVESVTAESVQATAQANLKPDQMVLLIVGNAAEFDESVAALGFGEPDTIDITIPSAEPEIELVIDEETLSKGKSLFAMLIAAHGGADNFSKIKAVSTKGTLNLITPQGELAISFTELRELPYKSSAVMAFMGRNLVNVTDDSTGWSTGADGNLTEKSTSDLETEQRETDRNIIQLLQNSDNSDYRAVYGGQTMVDSQLIERLTMIDSDDKPLCHFKIDGESFKLISQIYEGKTMMGAGTIEDIYFEMTEVDGIIYPFKNEKYLNGQKYAIMQYTELVLNPEIPAGSFSKPE